MFSNKPKNNTLNVLKQTKKQHTKCSQTNVKTTHYMFSNKPKTKSYHGAVLGWSYKYQLLANFGNTAVETTTPQQVTTQHNNPLFHNQLAATKPYTTYRKGNHGHPTLSSPQH
jgi:hypothetical protein